MAKHKKDPSLGSGLAQGAGNAIRARNARMKRLLDNAGVAQDRESAATPIGRNKVRKDGEGE